MLSYFPQIRNEESTYSIFSRLQFAMQPPNVEVMGKMIFNRKSEAGRLNFQGSFDYLCNNLTSNFTSENFLYNNTIYPLFIPFISSEKQDKALEYFKGDYPDKIHRFLTVNNVNRDRRYIRVCKECIKEDFDIYGEPYYRRQHEIEINRMCYKHRSPLYEYVISNYGLPRRYDDYLTVLSSSKEIDIPEKFREKFLDITDDINSIFTLNLDNLNIKITKHKILNRIKEKEFLKITGLNLQLEFCQDFKKHYSEEFLDFIGYNFDSNYQGSWFRRVNRLTHDNDPLKFILFIRYLFGSFKEFYQYNKEYSVFKKGPYPCLNKIRLNYNKLVIKDIMKIKVSNCRPVATFSCEHCGFQYYRSGPDKNDNDIYKKTHVKVFGHLWHDKLKECVNKGFSFSKTAKILGCNSIQTLTFWINKHNNPNLLKTTTIELSTESNSLLLEQYKKQILNFVKKKPTATKLDIYRYDKKAYSYLLKNDNVWLTNNISFDKKNKTISKEERFKNFWSNRDNLLASEVLTAINKIKSEKAPYKRLSVYTLEKYIGYYNFNQKRDKLPKCSKILDEVCETLIDYQKRRINYVMKEMADNSVKITTNKVFKNANLDNRENIPQEIHNYIAEMINNHNLGNVITIKNKDKL